MKLGLKSTSPVKTPCFVPRTTMFKDSTHKHFKLKLEVVLGGGLQSEPILANNATSFKGKESFFRVHISLTHLYYTTLFG